MTSGGKRTGAGKWAKATSEQDPGGRDPHQSGAKLDAGKNRLGLVLGDFAKALEQVGQVGTFGAKKYTDHGWLDVPNGVERYTDALWRHLLAEAGGEAQDQQTELLHLSHACWNLLAVLELRLRNELLARRGAAWAAQEKN